MTKEAGPIRVMIVDDHSIVRDGVSQILGKCDDIKLCAEAENAEEAVKQLNNTEIDLVIADITLSGSTSGIDLIKAINERFPHVKVLVMSMYDESLYGERAIRAGAQGYIMKEVGSIHLVDAIHKIMGGDLYLSEDLQKKIVTKLTRGSVDKVGDPVEMLSDRELEIYQLIGNGYSTKEISKKLNISMNTVESHRNKIKSKMNLKDSSDLVKHAIQWVISNSK